MQVEQPKLSMWSLKTEIQTCLGIAQELWGSLLKIHDHRAAVKAWELVLDGEGIREGELLDALKIWAKGADGTYPPRPGNLLEILKRERTARVHRAELDAWRHAGCPVIDSSGVVTRLELEVSSEPVERRALPLRLATVRRVVG